MTAKEFTRDENNRVVLQAILDNPVFQNALSVLKDELDPIITNQAVGNPVVGAAAYQQLAGAVHIIRGLKGLTMLPKPKVPLPTKPDLIKDTRFSDLSL